MHQEIGPAYLFQCHVKDAVTENWQQHENSNRWGQRTQEKYEEAGGAENILSQARSIFFPFIPIKPGTEANSTRVVEIIIAVTI